jgi:putative component of membrane protein insertase Oxa1/YidC/SpoIIIJ protein YidD/TM2 domain-containing membrane protein YozV
LVRTTVLLLSLVGASTAGYDPLSVCGEWMIGGYRLVVSPLQGPNICNFSPSCSQFTKAAMRSQGFLPGVLIGADRLMRCNTFAWSYYDSYYAGAIVGDRMPDPVENHIAWSRPTAEPGALVSVQLSPVSVLPSSAPAAPGPSLSFADFLYSSGEYEQAAAEYLRVRFTAGSAGLSGYAGLMAGESYLRAEDFSGARRAFLDLSPTPVSEFSRYGTARTLFAEARYAEARTMLDSVASPSLAVRARTLTGWTYFRQRRVAEGASIFVSLRSALPAQHLSTMDGHGIPRRSRLASSLLSIVVPGAGQVYSGRAGDGAYSFLTVVGTGLVTWFFWAEPALRDRTRVKVSIFGVLTALFYAGNIYGANVAARDYDLFQERRYLQRADSLFNLLPLEPDYRSLLDTVSCDTTRKGLRNED